MKRILIRLLPAWLLLTGAPLAPLYAEPAEIPLDLDAFVRQACVSDRQLSLLLQSELASRYQSRLKVPASALVGRIEGGYYFSLDPDKEGELEAGVSLGQLFPKTGTSLEAGFVRSEPSSLDSRNRFSLTLSQDVARNAFGASHRLLEQAAGIEEDLAGHQTVEAYEDYLAGLVSHYYQWYSAYARWQTSRSVLAEVERLLANVRARQVRHVANRTDVDKVRLQVMDRQSQVREQRAAYESLTAGLSRWLPAAEGTVWVPVEPAAYRRPEIAENWQAAWECLNRDSRTLRMLRLLDEKGRADLAYASDQLLPSARVLAGFRGEGGGREIADSRRDVFAGLSLDWPLSDANRAQARDLARARLAYQEHAGADHRARLAAELQGLHARLRAAREQTGTLDERQAVAQRVFDDEARYYQQGRTSLNDLIIAANRLVETRYQNIYDALQDYLLSVEWLRVTDQLVGKREDLPTPKPK